MRKDEFLQTLPPGIEWECAAPGSGRECTLL